MNASDPTPTPKAPPSPELRRAQRWNIVWVVPILAVLLGAWLLYRNFIHSGPVAEIHFETAEEIHANETEVRCRSVKVGMVKNVKLDEDLDSVLVVAEFQPDAAHLLREGTRFWVVKPRLSGAEISGLGTLIQGSYIELDPGPKSGDPTNRFEGLEVPPATNMSVPGRRLILAADDACALQIGAPIHYRGFEVGRIEGQQLAPDGSHVVYNAFIREAYSKFVTEHTRFWVSSGLKIDANPSGLTLRPTSLQSIISGSVSFGVADGILPGKPAQNNARYALFVDEDAAKRSTFNPSVKFLLLFDQSVRGLTTNSAVEYRGIPIGRISQISFDLLDNGNDSRIPVLVEIDPTLLRPTGDGGETQPDADYFKAEVARGLRAGLKTSNFLLGTVHIDFDYHPQSAAATLGTEGGYTTFPTVATSFAQLETKLNALIDKLQAVPLQ
ncbi:MAG TPA: MlaD family protein, partial [Luteolibacter sp.]|nr:MlaD family protein [Luteolibacter sp.]